MNKEYDFELELYNKQSKNFVFVLSSPDRIFVAFKGTSNTETMKTDINVIQTRADTVLPTIAGVETQRPGSNEWKAAKLHKGFSDAYKTLNGTLLEKLSELLRNKKRPIYLTGHSLGGALATICSTDIVLSLGINDVYVCTFGSPRTGNRFWARFYDKLVTAHWRLAIRSDVITTLPKMGYTNGGKRCALTAKAKCF